MAIDEENPEPTDALLGDSEVPFSASIYLSAEKLIICRCMAISLDTGKLPASKFAPSAGGVYSLTKTRSACTRAR